MKKTNQGSYYLFQIFVISLVIFISSTAVAAVLGPPLDFNAPWTLRKDADGIRMYTKPWPGDDFVAYKVDTVINTTVPVLLSVLQDIPNYVQWIGNCSESREAKKISERERISYVKIAGPNFLISDRDIYNQGIISQDEKTLAITINYHGVDYPEMPDVIRMSESEGSWSIIPVSKDKTRVIWQAHTRPNGSLPAWLVNWALDRVVFKSLAGLTEQVTKAKYKNVKMKPEWSWLKLSF